MYTKERLFEIGLLKLCEDLHMSLSGSGMPLTTEEENVIRNYLQDRLNEWVVTNDKFSYYDRAVKQLIEIALLEPKLYKSNENYTQLPLDRIIDLSFYD